MKIIRRLRFSCLFVLHFSIINPKKLFLPISCSYQAFYINLVGKSNTICIDIIYIMRTRVAIGITRSDAEYLNVSEFACISPSESEAITSKMHRLKSHKSRALLEKSRKIGAWYRMYE